MGHHTYTLYDKFIHIQFQLENVYTKLKFEWRLLEINVYCSLFTINTE